MKEEELEENEEKKQEENETGRLQVPKVYVDFIGVSEDLKTWVSWDIQSRLLTPLLTSLALSCFILAYPILLSISQPPTVNNTTPAIRHAYVYSFWLVTSLFFT